MNFTISFKNLTFTPEKKQVVYVENTFCEQANAVICDNYDDIVAAFSSHELEFVYLPHMKNDEDIERRVRYYAPYLQTTVKDKIDVQSNALLRFMAHPENREKIQPSLLYSPSYNIETHTNDFRGITLDEDAEITKQSFLSLASFIEILIREDECSVNDEPQFMLVSDSDSDSNSMCCEGPLRYGRQIEDEEPEVVDEEQEEFNRDLAELTEIVNRLKMRGVPLGVIHEFIDTNEPLSSMVITEDYRIFLPEYGNIEIKMGALPKSLFFLFLRYEEGIVLSNLQDHANELYNIYRQFRPNTNEERLRRTIERVCNPLNNSINENIFYIHKAFVSRFDEHLARNYYITGEPAEPYRITLSRDLVVWEE